MLSQNTSYTDAITEYTIVLADAITEYIIILTDAISFPMESHIPAERVPTSVIIL